MTASAELPVRHGPVMRADDASVKPLELFFDLVFVLALTQCTALMAAQPTWEGLARGLLILGVLWWTWVGYAWLTSVIDPEEGPVRLVFFASMAGLLVASLCVHDAFGDLGLVFAVCLLVVRSAHIALFVFSSRDEPELRTSVIGLAVGTAVGVGLLIVASFADGTLQGVLWLLALALDAGGPFLFGVEGWKLVPGHFAERHGLIVIIALGESIVAIGVGAEEAMDVGIAAAAVVGIVIAAALWWAYFDVVALVAERRLENAAPGRERNAIGRDSFSYLHFPMVAGIVLLALGLKKTLGARRGSTRGRAGLRAAGRDRAVPARARRLPLAQRAPLLHPPGPDGGDPDGVAPGRGRAPRARDDLHRRGGDGRVDRLRDGPLPGAAHEDAPRAHRPLTPMIVAAFTAADGTRMKKK